MEVFKNNSFVQQIQVSIAKNC